MLKAQVFAGYMDAKSGERLAYVVYVNNVKPIETIADVIKVFADEGVISACSSGAIDDGAGRCQPRRSIGLLDRGGDRRDVVVGRHEVLEFARGRC